MTKATCLLVAVIGLGAVTGWAQAPADGAALTPGTTIRVELEKKLDTKKAKVGDPVVVKVSENVKDNGAVIIPKNSLLTGEVTAVERGSKEVAAKLGVRFDQATDKNGKKLLHLRAAIVKIEQPESNGSSMLTRPTEMGGSGTAMVMDPGNPAYATLDRSSNGIPVQYSVMETANGSGADLGGEIVSVGGDFNLDEGTHVQVRVLH